MFTLKNKSVIIRMYTKQNRSLRYIAAVFGVSHTTINKYLSRWQVPRRNGEARQRHNVNDLVGRQFGQLQVLAQDVSKYPTHWLCRCSCGAMVSVPARGLINGKRKSCGCKRGNKSVNTNH